MKKVLVMILTVVLLLCGCSTLETKPAATTIQTPTEVQTETTTEPDESRKEVTKGFLLSATKDYDCEISVYDFGDGLDVNISFGKSANAWVFYDVITKATDTCTALRDRYGFQFDELTVISGTTDEAIMTWVSRDLETGTMADSAKGKFFKDMTIPELKEYLGQ